MGALAFAAEVELPVLLEVAVIPIRHRDNGDYGGCGGYADWSGDFAGGERLAALAIGITGSEAFKEGQEWIRGLVAGGRVGRLWRFRFENGRGVRIATPCETAAQRHDRQHAYGSLQDDCQPSTTVALRRGRSAPHLLRRER